MKTKMYKTQHRRQEIKKLNRSAKQKQRRLKKLYDIDIDVNTRNIDSFESGEEYKTYIKNLKQFTDYNTMRFVKVGRDVVPYEELKELQEVNIRRNKVNRKRMAEALKIIREETGEEVYLKDIDANPLLAHDLNISSYLPLPETMRDLKTKYQSSQGLDRAKEQGRKVAKAGYEKDARITYYDNLLQGIVTDFGGFKDHKKLLKYIKSKGVLWVNRKYLVGDIKPFEFVYSFGDLEHNFHGLLRSFNFIYDEETQEWYSPDEIKLKRNKEIKDRNISQIKQLQEIRAQETPLFKYRMRYKK